MYCEITVWFQSHILIVLSSNIPSYIKHLVYLTLLLETYASSDKINYLVKLRKWAQLENVELLFSWPVNISRFHVFSLGVLLFTNGTFFY